MEKNDENIADGVPQDEWKIRPCLVYEEEYNDCKSFKARFNQYFVFGEFQDCIPWKKDYENCRKWMKDNDFKARENLIKSENLKREQRLKAHYNNDVWTKRDEPPKDWNKPLPDWMQERLANTYLDIKCREMKGEKVSYLVNKDGSASCTIL